MPLRRLVSWSKLSSLSLFLFSATDIPSLYFQKMNKSMMPSIQFWKGQFTYIRVRSFEEINNYFRYRKPQNSISTCSFSISWFNNKIVSSYRFTTFLLKCYKYISDIWFSLSASVVVNSDFLYIFKIEIWREKKRSNWWNKTFIFPKTFKVKPLMKASERKEKILS